MDSGALIANTPESGENFRIYEGKRLVAPTGFEPVNEPRHVFAKS
jgi:hypothetical protein